MPKRRLALVVFQVACLGRYLNGLRTMRRDFEGRSLEPGLPVEIPDGIRITIIVPVKDEQGHVSASLEHFAGLVESVTNVRVIFVTTSADTPLSVGGELRTTQDVLLAEFEKLSRDQRGLVTNVHYTGAGRKAAQLNFVVEELEATGWINDDSYILVYDVDSRPTATGLRRVFSEIVSFTDSNSGFRPSIIQQSAIFHAPHGNRSDFIVSGAAILQTLWTLRRELSTFRDYRLRVMGARRMWLNSGRLVLLVGHGLVMRSDVPRRVGGFPEYSLLEDNPLGFEVSSRDIDVWSSESLTTAEVPPSAREWLEQGDRWFHSYMDLPACRRSVLDAGVPLSVANAVLAVSVYRGANWLLRSPGTLTMIAASLFGRGAVRILGIAGLMTSAVLPVRTYRDLIHPSAPMHKIALWSAEYVGAACLSSIGPCRQMLRKARNLSWN